MSLANAFRLSFYLSLAMSCACLFYGEWDFLPWMSALLPLVLATMVAAYRREGRAYISELTANRIGTCIGLGTVLWIVIKSPRSDQDLIAGGVPWPAMLVPLLAPLLPILLLVKLFRPKRVQDFWVFQIIALVIVTLSCILAGEVLFFGLLTGYLVLQLWCLGLFFLYRNLVLTDAPLTLPSPPGGEGRARGDTLFGAWQSQDPRPIPRQSLRPGRVLGWCVVILVVGLGFFLLLPRFTDSPWVPTKLSSVAGSMKTGIDPGAGMDLYREGIVEMSPAPAFEVEVRGAAGPASLSATQHWRMLVLDEYSRGHWQTRFLPDKPGRLKALPSEKHLVDNTTFPAGAPDDMNDSEVFLVYHVNAAEAGGLPLADPIAVPDNVGLYPRGNKKPIRYPLFRLNEEEDTIVNIEKTWNKHRDKQLTYGQILAPKFQDREVPAIGGKLQGYAKTLLTQDVPAAIQTWTRGLLRKLPDLAPADYEADSQGALSPSSHAKIARALSRHLADSGEFSYSLRLHPLGRANMDPTAEFLLKVKEGHCERYAAGLTLMLRSLQIPARIVKGYSGCELLERGRYVIRQNQAHSWVEALVPGKEIGTCCWLQLDPTPSRSGESDSMAPFLKWAWTRLTNPDFTWKSLVMDYNTDRQTEVRDQFKGLWNSVSATSSDPSTWEGAWSVVRWPALGLLGLITALLGCWGWRRWSRARALTLSRTPSPGFHARLLRVLERYCELRPHVGQTPLEFAHVAQEELRKRLPAATAGALTELPMRAVLVLYQQIFGGRPLEPESSRVLEAEVAQLESVLREMAVV